LKNASPNPADEINMEANPVYAPTDGEIKMEANPVYAPSGGEIKMEANPVYDSYRKEQKSQQWGSITLNSILSTQANTENTCS